VTRANARAADERGLIGKIVILWLVLGMLLLLAGIDTAQILLTRFRVVDAAQEAAFGAAASLRTSGATGHRVPGCRGCGARHRRRREAHELRHRPSDGPSDGHGHGPGIHALGGPDRLHEAPDEGEGNGDLRGPGTLIARGPRIATGIHCRRANGAGDRDARRALRARRGAGTERHRMVWEATDTVLDRTVAVKVLRPSISDDPRFAEGLARETGVVAQVTGPGLVQLLDSGSDRGVTFLVREHVRGESLRATLVREGRLSPDVAVRTVLRVLEGLASAHAAGMLHLDVKPENVIADASGEVRLTDLGLGRRSPAPIRHRRRGDPRPAASCSGATGRTPPGREDGRLPRGRTAVRAALRRPPTPSGSATGLPPNIPRYPGVPRPRARCGSRRPVPRRRGVRGIASVCSAWNRAR